jgi:YVTN family beta-propeller protein
MHAALTPMTHRVPMLASLRRGAVPCVAAVSVALGVLATAPSALAGVAYTAYVGNLGSDNLVAINTATNVLGSTSVIANPLAIPINDPAAIAITPDGTTAWVADSTIGIVTPITLATGAVGSPVIVGSHPSQIAITPDGTRAYVTNNGSGTVTPLYLVTKTVGAAISVGANPYAIAITPDGSKAFVTNDGSNTVTPVTLATNTAGPPIAVGGRPEAIAITPDGRTAWVANYQSNSLTPVSVATNAVGPAVAVNSPDAIAITPDGSKAYVANYGQGTVTPVTLSTRALGAPIGVGREPNAIAITPDQATAYVTSYNAGGASTATAINLASSAAVRSIAVGSEPDAVAIAPDQAPVASFAVAAGRAGSPTFFDASASTADYGAITSYAWKFGDGATATTASPTATHIYAAAGRYTATLTETDAAGTSITQVFTGQTVSRNGGASARTARSVLVSPAPPATPPRRPARVLLPTTSLTITPHGNVLVPVTCPAHAPGGCRGTITIRLAQAHARRATAVAARCARGCRALGTATYQARAGQRVHVRVHIASFARRLLARDGLLRVTVTATSVSHRKTASTARTINMRAHSTARKRDVRRRRSARPK